MRILIADDDPVSREMQACLLQQEGHEIIEARDGAEAWSALQSSDPPSIAILDWHMPQIKGIEICRRARATPALKHLYLMLQTATPRDEGMEEGLKAGANDYLAKPFRVAELRARVRMGGHVVQLQNDLAIRDNALQRAVTELNALRAILPLCGYCRKPRNDQNYWHEVNAYFDRMINAEFSHGLCPVCYESVIRPQLDCMGITFDSLQSMACSAHR